MESGGNEGILMMEKKKGIIIAEVKKQLWLAGPLVSVNCLLFFVQIISVMFVGHLGELALAGASMATSFAGVTGFSILLGMACALDTFCGQAFGAKQYHMLGVYMQRAMLILSLVSIPIMFIWAYTGQILMLFKQNQEISIQAGVYARWLIPSIFAYGLLQCKMKFLQTQNMVFPMVMSSGITLVFHVPVCWFLVFKSGLGIRGAALANSVSYWVNVGLLAIYVKLSPACKNTWNGFSKDAFSDVPSFLKLALPSAMMVCLEFWSFEMLVLVAGLLPNPKLQTSILSISLNTLSIEFMVVLALSSVVSIRVSNELGAGQPRAALQAVCVMMSIVAIECVASSLGLFLLRSVWGKLYSNEAEVVKHVASITPLLAASMFLDGLQCALSGIVRGIGKQKIGAYVNLGAYYIVGLPCGILFAFVLHLKGKGLMLGIISALFTQLMLLMMITIFTNWEKEAKKAGARFDSPTEIPT